MSDDLRAAIAEDGDVRAAESDMRETASLLLEATMGTGPFDRRTEHAILRAAQAYRNAENARNRAVADAVRRLL